MGWTHYLDLQLILVTVATVSTCLTCEMDRWLLSPLGVSRAKIGHNRTWALSMMEEGATPGQGEHGWRC